MVPLCPCNIKCFFIASLPLLLHLQEICQFQISDPNGAGICPMEAFIWRWFLRGLIMIPSYPINDENNMNTMSNCMNISLTCLHCNSLIFTVCVGISMAYHIYV